MKPNKSKMESKEDLIKKHTRITKTTDGVNTFFDYPSAMDEWSNQQNATLIAEHKMMKEALENIEKKTGSNFGSIIAHEALKNITL